MVLQESPYKARYHSKEAGQMNILQKSAYRGQRGGEEEVLSSAEAGTDQDELNARDRQPSGRSVLL